MIYLMELAYIIEEKVILIESLQKHMQPSDNHGKAHSEIINKSN